MDAIDIEIAELRQAAQTHGLSALARESGVAYTTVKSFADRDWSNKNLDIARRLFAAAHRLTSGDAA